VHTFGKAMGCHGAAVTGSKILTDYLINFSRPFIYTTALPPHCLQAIQCAYNSLAANKHINQPLQQLISYFRKKLVTPPGMYWTDSRSPIQALVTGSNETATTLARHLTANQFDVRAILSPTVAAGKERIRFCLHTYNNETEIEKLMYEIGRFISERHTN
jgi:8-amino-7-oxononanoate synthase